MGENLGRKSKGKPVAVVVGATSKWQSDGRNTKLAHGQAVDDSDLPVGIRWGIGGAIAQKFAGEGFFVVLTTRSEANASGLAAAIRDQGGDCMIVELDLSRQDSIAAAFATIRGDAGDPHVLIYNAGYLEGRDLPPEKELLEHIPVEMFDTAQHIASRGPFLVAKEVLPAMRKRGEGSFFFSNNSSSLRGRKRMTGQSLYYPRVMMRTLAQVLTEEYSEHGVHVANVVIDGTIDSPGTHALPRIRQNPDLVINPGEDRRGVLLPAHPGPVVLDARAAADAVFDQAELLTDAFLPQAGEVSASSRRRGHDIGCAHDPSVRFAAPPLRAREESGLFGLGAGFLDDGQPERLVVLDQLAGGFGRAGRQHLEALDQELLLHLRVLADAVDLGIEARDDRARRVRRQREAQPRGDHEVGHAGLDHRRHVGQHGRAVLAW